MDGFPKLDDRKATVLRAIVSHYVRSGEPAGSKTLVDRFRLGVSSATVRNEMAALEDAGYIYQPHTSAGRIPTDAGYRMFVDSWATSPSLPADEAAVVRRFFTEPRWELEETLRETASLLSSLTNHAAVVFAPALDRSVVRRIELVRLTGDRAMILVVTDTGRVTNTVGLVSEDVDDVQLDQATKLLNKVVEGVSLEDTGPTIMASIDRFPLELRDVVKTVARSVDDELGKSDLDRVILEGASNIVEEGKFSDLDTVRQVIGALEHRRLILEVLADAFSTDRVSVRIGSENPLEEMQFCSVITAAYGTDDAPVGSLGIVGPTRMDYRRTIATVHEVAEALGRMFRALGL